MKEMNIGAIKTEENNTENKARSSSTDWTNESGGHCYQLYIVLWTTECQQLHNLGKRKNF